MPNVDITIRTIADNDRATKGVIGSFTELKSAIGLAGQGLQVAKKIYDESAGAALKYANEVRQLSMVSESTENTSRFIQVLDDYKISTDDAMAATRKLTANGLAPNIDTLAKLADQYRAINTVEERNKFVMDNLGRSGTKWNEILSKGGDALREQADAIADNLILSQKAVDQARAYEVAQDSLNDSVMGLKISIGNQLIPVLMEQANVMRDDIRAMEILEEQGINSFWATMKQQQAAKAQAIAEREAADALMLNAEALKNNTYEVGQSEEAIKAQEEAEKAQVEMMKKMTDANREYLSSLGSLSDQMKDFEEESWKIRAQQHDLREEINKLIDKGYSPLGDKVKELEHDYAVLGLRAQDLAAEQELAGRRMVLSMLEVQLSMDGLQAHETEYLVRKGVEWGIYSEKAILALMEAQEEVRQFVEEVNGIPTERTFTLNTNINHVAVGNFQSGDRGGGHYANGGSFIIPQRYGNEGFNMGGMATASGGETVTISPKGQGGGGIDYNRLARVLRDTLQQVGG